MAAAILFDQVWKKFRQGERHDSLRDLIPGLTRRLFAKPPPEGLKSEEFWALQDVSFAVEPGQALGIIGSNGAGKSTTLKLLTKILKPTRGRYETRGRVGALIEVAAGFHPDLTGRENVFLQGAIMGMPRTEIARQFDAIVDFAGIGKFIDTPVKRYSSGMNARLGFSIAAFLEPEVLLIDEVLAVGDMEFQNRCFDRMRQFTKQGTAIAFVSHNLKAVLDLCDQAVLLQFGKVRAAGKTSDVVAEYLRQGPTTKSDSATLHVHTQVFRNQSPLDNVDELQPGDEIVVEGDLTFLKEIEQATVGIGVWDCRSSSVVFGGSLFLEGVPPVRVADGDAVHFRFALNAHLNRGLYQIRVDVYDLATQQILLEPQPVATFNVVERSSQTGSAHLYLRPLAFDLKRSPQLAPLGAKEDERPSRLAP